MTDRVVNTLRGLLAMVQATEALLVDLVAAVSPWLAPLTPALLTWQSMTNTLGFPVWAAWAAAATVETLGLSSIQTAYSLWSYEGNRRKSDPRAPVLVAILTGAFYLVTVITVNALLDPGPPIHKLAKGLLSSLSVCAGLVLALRAGHAKRLQDLTIEKAERKAERQATRKMKERRRAEVARDPLPAGPDNGRGRGGLMAEVITR